MDNSWLPRAIVPLVISLVFALLRRFAPAPPSRFMTWRYADRQAPEPLPTGVIGGFMWAIGIALILTFFLFRGANHLWASMDPHSSLTLYPTLAIWCFFPGFAAVSIPWPFTVWLLYKLGRKDEADAISELSDQQDGLNNFVVLKWCAFGLVMPIGLFTLLAIPMHLSLCDTEARLGHYGSFHEDLFPYSQATRATIVDGTLAKNGKIAGRDLVIDFQDGRRLRANAVGDGGSSADQRAIDLLLARTGLTANHVTDIDEISPQ